MHGKNQIRYPVTGSGETLDVQEIFATIQGEGPRAGAPAVFIRLGGCNLACAFCDTEFESFSPMTADGMLERVKALAGGNIRLAVITGGEPLRQPIELLCSRLLKDGFRVQIETNGTLYRALPEEVEIVCSPKNTGSGYYPLRRDLLARVNALKFIISCHDPLYMETGEVGQAERNIPVYVQPMDEYDAAKNAANFERCKNLALERGYLLSVQLHKIIGVP